MLPETPVPLELADARPSKCSAFVLLRDGETYLTRNNWNCCLDQSQALSLWLAGDFMTANTAGPNEHLVTPTYVLGINCPASMLVRSELESVDIRPARRPQFMSRIGGVHDVESAKAPITYIDPTNPLSIYGRRDLGYGITPAPKTVPDGSCDAEAVTASQVRQSFKLEGVLDKDAGTTAFWRKYGTPEVNGEPFIWSRSQWAGQKLRFVPDRVEGGWQLLHLYIR